VKKTTLHTLLFLLLIVLSAVDCKAQDPQMTQFYAAPVYLNPAFVGAHGCTKAVANYRDQWPQIPGKFVTYMASVENYFPSINSSGGILFTRDQAGTGKLRTTTVNAIYSYGFLLSKKWEMRLGLQGGWGHRNINFYDLTFGDQIARGNASTTMEPNPAEPVSYIDFSTGVLAQSSSEWIGFAIHHLNEPEQGLLNTETGKLPRKYSLHGGKRFLVKEATDKDQFVTAAFNYRAQNKFDQFDLGFYYTYNVVNFGMWYRGIPLLKAYQPGYANNDAFAFLFGFSKDKLSIGYSYDFTISRLINNTGGAHELSLSYMYCHKKKKRKRPIFMPCPKF
jgi:type IX secretion system PorP/SprF family membrane protein